MADRPIDSRSASIARETAVDLGPVSSKGGAQRLFGSLKDALLAAGREPTEPIDAAPTRTAAIRASADYERAEPTMRYAPPVPAPQPPAIIISAPAAADGHSPDYREPVAEPRAVKVVTPAGGPSRVPVDPAELSLNVPRTQPLGRGAGARSGSAARTQLLRGRQKVSREKFHQDPVVGWLVIVGGPGLGAHRSIYEGNNTVGRASTQRIPIDFGDDTISSEEQAYIRYDSHDRSFLFVPNLAKTNVVQVNDAKPTGAIALQAMDVITMGRTQLVFVPFCGAEFDWGELAQGRE